MPLGLTAQTNIAFKNLLGKSETYVVSELASEFYGIGFNVPSNNIWLNQLSNSATQSVLLGYAIAVTASLISITSSNGHAYTANWPVTPPSGTDLSTGLPFTYNSGSLLGISAGNIVQNAISDSYGQSYTINLYGTNGSVILSSDSRNWIYQYNSGIFFQENIGSLNPATASLYVYIGQTLQSQPNTPYTAASSSEVSVGGISSGTSFTNVSLTNVLNNLLYPSTQAKITNFQIQGVNNLYEVGNGIIGGSYVISWTISNTASLASNTVYIYGTAGNAVIGPTSNNSPISSYTLPTIVSTIPLTYNWGMSVKQSSGVQVSSLYTVNWCYNLFYGATTSPGLTNSFNNLQSSILGTSSRGVYVLPNIGTPSYKYIVVPDSFSALSLITLNSTMVPMADATDGYTFSANNLNYKLVSYTNLYSVSSNYKIYRTKYMLTATMSCIVIS